MQMYTLEELVRFGYENAAPQPLLLTLPRFERHLAQLEEQGSTALGNAVGVALGICSKRENRARPARIVIATGMS